MSPIRIHELLAELEDEPDKAFLRSLGNGATSGNDADLGGFPDSHMAGKNNASMANRAIFW